MRKIIQIGLILAGIGMASYPLDSNSLYEKEAGSRIQVYEKKSRDLPKKNYQNLCGKQEITMRILQKRM